MKRGPGFVWHICGRDIRLLNLVMWLRVEIGVVLEEREKQGSGGGICCHRLPASSCSGLFLVSLVVGVEGLPRCFWKGWRPIWIGHAPTPIVKPGYPVRASTHFPGRLPEMMWKVGIFKCEVGRSHTPDLAAPFLFFYRVI